jgi:hypothetical protein
MRSNSWLMSDHHHIALGRRHDYRRRVNVAFAHESPLLPVLHPPQFGSRTPPWVSVGITGFPFKGTHYLPHGNWYAFNADSFSHSSRRT